MLVIYKGNLYQGQSINLKVIDCVSKEVTNISDIKEVLKDKAYVITGYYGKYLIQGISEQQSVEILADYLGYAESQIFDESKENGEKYYQFWNYDCIAIQKFSEYKKEIR